MDPATRTWQVHTSLHQSEHKEDTRAKLLRSLQSHYWVDPETELTWNGDRLIITIEIMAWEEEDAEYFEGLYERELITAWHVVEVKDEE